MENQVSIGTRMQQRRQVLEISLREVARRTGLSASFLSQVERGESNVSLDSLRKIAEALDVQILFFLSAEAYPGADEATVYVLRGGSRPRLSLADNRVAYELLTPDLNHQMEVVLGRLSPGSGNVARRLKVPTEECIFVLCGELRVGIGSEDLVLRSGDSVYFTGAELHTLMCASKNEDAVWLSMITPPAL